VLNPPALSSSASSRASARLRARVVFVRRPRSRRSERSRLAVDRPASAAAAWRSSSASRSESVTSCPITSSVTIEQQHARKGLFLSSAGAAAAARQPRGADQRQISACVAFPPKGDSLRTEARGSHPASGRLQLVIGDDRAEMSLHDLERLEDRPLFQELAVVLRALPVVASTDILGRKMSAAIPTPAAWRHRIRVDRSCQLVMAAVADVAKAVEMAVLRLDESEPRVPERVSPVEGLKEWRVDLTSAI
jgi:hypothetical protein